MAIGGSVIASFGRVLAAFAIGSCLAGSVVTAWAQTPQQPHETIRLQPPPKPGTGSQLAAAPNAAVAAAPQPHALDEAFHVVDQTTPIVPVTPIQQKTVQGPVSVQAPKSVAQPVPGYLAVPAPAVAYNPAPVSQAQAQRPFIQAPNPGPPPPEIRDLATLSEPSVANAPQRSEQPGPERLAQTTMASNSLVEIAGPVADGSTELTTSPLDASALNTASVAFGILGMFVALGAVIVAKRSRS
jgi:hypothetical protein